MPMGVEELKADYLCKFSRPHLNKIVVNYFCIVEEIKYSTDPACFDVLQQLSCIYTRFPSFPVLRQYLLVRLYFSIFP